ncbi:MAG: MinD/ParA family protein [bacterium]|nr:MinD/ParA family protein [bacterium]
MRDQAANLREQFKEPTPQKVSGQGLRSLSFTSGKGGVGKSNIVVNLSVQLAKMGKKVLLLDADLGLANIDIMLNLVPQFTIEDVLTGKKNVNEVIMTGPEGVHILPASSGITEMSELTGDQQLSLIQELSRLKDAYDYILIDTGAGIASSVLRFNAAADEVCVVTNTEPTSMTDAYALMKIMATKYQIKRFNLIVNSARGMDEAKQVHRKLETVFNQFLPVELVLTGFIPRDPNISKAVRAQTPLSVLYPNSPTAKAFYLLAKHLDANPGKEANLDRPNFFQRLGLWNKR